MNSEADNPNNSSQTNLAQAKTADMCFKDAVELVRMIRAREISAKEVMAAFLAQIKRVNPKVNAICTFIGEEAAMRAARFADHRQRFGGNRGHSYDARLADLQKLRAGRRADGRADESGGRNHHRQNQRA